MMEVDGSWWFHTKETVGKVVSKYMGFPLQRSWYVLGDVCSLSGSWFLAYTLQLHWHHWKLHPGRLTWNLRIDPWKRKIIFQIIIFNFYVNLPGCSGWNQKNSGVVQMMFLFQRRDAIFRWNQPLSFFRWVSPTTVSRVHKVAFEGAKKTGTDSIVGGTQHYQLCG